MELNSIIFSALRLDSEQWLVRLIEACNTFPHWGTQWVEAAVNEDEDALWRALSEGSPMLIANFYAFLHAQYPAPRQHQDGKYRPGSLDRINQLKSRIILFLARSGQPGSTAALRILPLRFPTDTWMQDCIIDADRAERAQRVPQLSCSDIKALRAEGNAMAMVVRNESDLLESVLRALSRYQVYLQGDQSRVADLWDRDPLILPRNENYFSSHLVSFLRKDLNRGTIINREVNIQDKLYSEANSGSRTDIWIQTSHKDGSILTLCIEVKCNWNKESADAIEGQLVKKYMSGGTATAGILLIAWFSCEKWYDGDNRKLASTSLWKSKDECLADLETQAATFSTLTKPIAAFVIDCGMS